MHAVQETTACIFMASLVGLWNQQGMLGDKRLKARQQVLVYILQIYILLVPIAVLHSVPGAKIKLLDRWLAAFTARAACCRTCIVLAPDHI